MRFVKTITALALCALAVGVVATWASGGALIKVSKSPSLGRYVTNSSGRTLYLFRGDSGTKSNCYGKCATFWPPLLTTGKPVAGPGVTASLLGTTKRKDGKLQVTFKGHPLYTFVQDAKAGQTKGEGLKAFGANWYAMNPKGITIDKD